MFDIQRRAGTAVVRVNCEVNVFNASAFRDAMYLGADGFTKHLIVALDKCMYVDSTAINELICLQGLLRIPVTVVVRSNQFLNKRFNITELCKHLRIVETLGEATSGVSATYADAD